MSPQGPSESEIRDWCLEHVRRMVGDPAIVVGPDVAFTAMGLDSASSAYFIVELEEWLGTELEPELVGEYPTIAELARHVAARRSGEDAGPG